MPFSSTPAEFPLFMQPQQYHRNFSMVLLVSFKTFLPEHTEYPVLLQRLMVEFISVGLTARLAALPSNTIIPCIDAWIYTPWKATGSVKALGDEVQLLSRFCLRDCTCVEVPSS